jgi:error-prone DNA polymerase
MSATMLKVHGIVQREGEVIHIIAQHIEDASAMLGSIGDMAFPHRVMPADGASGGGGPDPRSPKLVRSRDIYIPPFTEAAAEGHAIPIKSRNFH